MNIIKPAKSNNSNNKKCDCEDKYGPKPFKAINKNNNKNKTN